MSRVLSSDEVARKVGASMPLPSADVEAKVGKIAEWLIGFDKSKYMFLMPEIALIEEMGRQAKSDTEFIIVVPCDLEEEAKERVNNNLPRGLTVTILKEPFFLESIYPSNGMIVVSGYSGGNHSMVLQDTYRMVEHYSSFRGKTVFVPYVELDTAIRYEGWMEIGKQRLSAEWRSET